MTFALALGLGIEGHQEVVDLDLFEHMDPSAVLSRLAAVAPDGFVLHGARALPPETGAPQPRAVEYCIPVFEDRREQAQSALATLLAKETWPFIRRRAERELRLDLRQQIREAELTSDGMLRFRLIVSPGGSVRPEELLEALALGELLECGAVLTRTCIDIGPDDDSTLEFPQR